MVLFISLSSLRMEREDDSSDIPRVSYLDATLPVVERFFQAACFDECERGVVHYHLLPDKLASTRVASIPGRLDLLRQAAHRFSPANVAWRLDHLPGLDAEASEQERAREVNMIALEAQAFAVVVDPRPDVRYRAALLGSGSSDERVERAAILGRDLRFCSNLHTTVHGDLLGHAIKERDGSRLSQVRQAAWSDYTVRARTQRAESRSQLLDTLDRRLSRTIYEPVEPEISEEDQVADRDAERVATDIEKRATSLIDQLGLKRARSSSSVALQARFGLNEGEQPGIDLTGTVSKVTHAGTMLSTLAHRRDNDQPHRSPLPAQHRGRTGPPPHL